MTDDIPDHAPNYDAMQRRARDSRERIDDTVVALRRRLARLAPRNLMEQTMNTMRRTSGQTSRYDAEHGHDQSQGWQSQGWSASVGETVRNNPIPLAMIGLGIGWLAMTATGTDRRIAHSRTMHSVRDRAEDAAQYARDTFYSASGSVRDAASHAYDRASNAVSGATESVRDMGTRTYRAGAGDGGASGRSMDTMSARASGMTDRLWDMVDEHPLMAGVLGVALGAAIGASIPSTRIENRWVGDYADEATSQAKQLAREAMDRGTRAARAAVEAAKEEVGHTVAAAGDAAREETAKPS